MLKPIIAIAWSQYPANRTGYRSGNPLPDPFYFDLLVDGDEPPTHLPLYARVDLMGESLDRYMNFVTLGGGVPVVVPIERATDSLSEIMDRIDGVLLSGGDDVAPSFFSEKPLSRECTGNLPRTWSETAMIREAVSRKLPMFGICRGIQQLNVTFGGTLIQDIPSQYDTNLNHYQPDGTTFHTVATEGNTKLAGVFSCPTFITNSWHHQAIKQVSPGGVVVARAPDGMIEAVEWEQYRAVGVQWHPERMVKNPVTKALAEYFIEQCRNRKS